MSEQAQQTEAVESQPAPEQPKSFWGKVDNWFGITKSGSNFRTEVVAGLTTFMAMVYILMVNAGMFQGVITDSADPYGAAYVATAIGAIVGTLLMALFAKMPLAQASGMGINAFIVFSLISSGDDATGLTYANCMVFTLLDGVIFLVLTVTGLRKRIFEAIPAGVRHAIPVGIGMFIAFIGMQQAGIIVDDGSTLTSFVSFNVLDENASFVSYVGGNVGGMLPAIVAIIGVFAIVVLSKRMLRAQYSGVFSVPPCSITYCLQSLMLQTSLRLRQSSPTYPSPIPSMRLLRGDRIPRAQCSMKVSTSTHTLIPATTTSVRSSSCS